MSACCLPEEPLPSRPERGLAVSWSLAAGRPVRSLVAGTAREGVPELVVVPGLGALGYLVPLVTACAAWTRVHLVDLPGFGHRTTARLPGDLSTVSRALSAWLAAPGTDGAGLGQPVLLLGHSTGAQAALRAALTGPGRVDRLVLAGVTFAPQTRRTGPLARRVLRTLPHEQTGQVPAVLPYYRRGLRRLPALLASSLADAPDTTVEALIPPLLVLRGEHDRLCSADWAAQLAARAPDGRAHTLPGAHNFPWTVPELTSQVLRDACRPPQTGR